MEPMALHTFHLCPDHTPLAEGLLASERLLIIQDLDGVCMGLVRDPRCRAIEQRYVEASRALAGHFFVLTNGEHIGSRGVNSIIEAAFDDPGRARAEGFYLPGLAGGGVQLQDAFGRVSHPGVSAEELHFLHGVPGRARHWLDDLLRRPPHSLAGADAVPLVEACVLDNAISPTVNLNPLRECPAAGDGEGYRALQAAAAAFMRDMLGNAEAAGLENAFFVHFAPNLGRDERGDECMKPATAADPGTTDFQFMLRGAVKEVGVLVLLNHYYFRHYGEYPLGESFNAREAPAEPAALLTLAEGHFDRARMPRIVGVGDTVTAAQDGERRLRGGSDRGFLSLVQALGDRFGTDNATVLVDSSDGELQRPSVDPAALDNPATRWDAVAGITDPQDPLTLNFLFPGGHRQYVDFFCGVARRWRERPCHAAS
jgi:glucosylglycerol 3-phosphatase